MVNGVFFFWLLKLCNKRYKKGKVKLQTKNTNLEENLQEINQWFYNLNNSPRQTCHPILAHILCPSQPVFSFSAACLAGKTAHTNVIAVGLTRLGLKSMIFLIECEHTNHYITTSMFFSFKDIFTMTHIISDQYTCRNKNNNNANIFIIVT